jgi:hypothetical protein
MLSWVEGAGESHAVEIVFFFCQRPAVVIFTHVGCLDVEPGNVRVLFGVRSTFLWQAISFAASFCFLELVESIDD